jgi:hypothetical protein
MIKAFRCTLPLFIALGAIGAQAQYLTTHGASISVGATGQFNTTLNAEPETSVANAPFTPGGTYPVVVANKQQFPTQSVGFLTSLQIYPVSWAGVEFNYGFTHYQERYTFNYLNTGNPSALQQVRIPTDAHEATGAYLFHPRHIKFQPFIGIGGGAIDFAPSVAANQWRGAGLLELGFDMPVPRTHVGFRVEGRSLYYRAPNFYQPAISTISWRVTTEPSVSAYYRF